MLEFINFTDAENKANEISKNKKTSISIIRRCNETPYIVCETSNERKSHDTFVALITNYETRFKVVSNSPKSGEHTDYFATQIAMDKFITEIKGYRTNIFKKFLTNDEYNKECVLPYKSSDTISEKYLQTLRDK